MTAFDKGTITVLGCALLIALLALPLVLRKVPPNRLYGYRTCATLGDEALWYAANAHFGRGMLAACGLAVLAVLALRGLGGLGADAFVAASAATLAIPLLAAVAATWRFVRAWQRRDRGVRPK